MNESADRAWPEQPQIDASKLVQLLGATVHGEDVGTGLKPFARWFANENLTGDPAVLRAYVEQRRSDVAGLLRSRCDATRHAAAFALSAAPAVENVEPLMALLVDQQDSYDHDFAYASIGSLGELALAELGRIAEEGGPRAFQAVQALGQCRAPALPLLERLARSEPPVPGLYSAVYNQHDPAALLWVSRGFVSADAETRSEALFTGYCLLEMAREQEHEVLEYLDRDEWSGHLLRLYQDEAIEAREVALAALAFLQTQQHTEVLVAALAIEDARETAIEALGWMAGSAALAALVRLLDADLEDACLAAVGILRLPDAPEALQDRARQTMLQGIVELDGSHAWCEAAQRLRADVVGRRVILDYMRTAPPVAQQQLLESIAFCCHHDEGRDFESLVAEADASYEWLARAKELVKSKL